MALPKSFSFSPYQGRAGQGPQFGQVLTTATDQLGDFAEADKLEAEKIAQNEIWARVQQGESLEDVLATVDPSLIDAASIIKANDDLLNSASGRAVDESSIRSNDANALLTGLQADTHTAESEANIKRMLAAAGASEAQISEFTAQAKQREHEQAEEERKRTGFAGINQYLEGGELDQQVETDFAKFAKDNKLKPEEAAQIRDRWLSDHRADLMADPRFLNKLFLKNNVTPLEATEGTQIGQMSNFTQQALATAQAELSTRQKEVESKTLESMRKYADNKADEFDIVGGEERYGTPAQKLNVDSAKVFVRDRGIDVTDDETMEVVDSLRINFPGSGAFETVLNEIREEGASKLKRGSIAHILSRRKALQENAAFQANLIDNPVALGGSASENALAYLQAQRTFTQTPDPDTSSIDSTTSTAETELINALIADGIPVKIDPSKSGNAGKILRNIDKLRKDLERGRKPGGRAYSTQELAAKEKELKDALLYLEKPALAPLDVNSLFPGNRVKP